MSDINVNIERILANAHKRQNREDFQGALKLYMDAYKSCPEDLKKNILIDIGNCNYLIGNYTVAMQMYLNSINMGHDKTEVTELILELFYNEENSKSIYDNNIKLLSKYQFCFEKNFLPYEQVTNKVIYSDDCIAIIYSEETKEVNSIKYDKEIASKNNFIGKVILVESIFSMRYLINLEIETRTKNPFLWMKDAFYIYYPNMQSLSTALTHENIKVLLSFGRVVTLVDEGGVNKFFENKQTVLPTELISTQHIKTLIASINLNRNISLNSAAENIKKYYSDNKDKIVENIKNDNAKILFSTSRFTTILQYHTRDACNACLNLGYNARITMEKADIYKSSDFLFIVDEFKPDIIFVIDWFRFSIIPFIDEVIFVTWMQDHMPHILSKDTPSKLKERDFILNHFITWDKILEIGYPEERTMDAPVVCNSNIYKHYQLTEEEYKKYSCDIVIVCANAYSRGSLDDLINRYNTTDIFKKSLNDIHDKHSKLFYNGKFPIFSKESKEIFFSTFSKNGLKINDKLMYTIIQDYSINVGQPLYREVLATWLIDAGYTNIKLWGRTWDKNSKFEKYAMGVAENGETLSKIYNASKITIGNNLLGTGAARVYESILSGCFYLSNVAEARDVVRLDKILIKGEEFDDFNSKDELLNKLEFYLNNPEDREKFIINGQKKIKEKQTFEALMKNMMIKLKDNL